MSDFEGGTENLDIATRPDFIDAFSGKTEVLVNSDTKEAVFSSHGLIASIQPYGFDHTIRIDNQSEIQIKKGDLVARVDFMPLKRSTYKQGNELFALALGAKGMDEFLHHIYDQDVPSYQRLPYVKYLEGETTLRMAIVTKRLGMEYSNKDEHEKKLKDFENQFKNGNLSEDGHEIERNDYLDQTKVRIVAELGKVRQKFLEMEKDNTVNKLLERARREAQNPNKGSK